MRITNSMMVASTKININGNKTSVDHLNRQLANQKKIIKPSDDPVLAIRSLRLRSSLSTIDQYYERNIPDTESWMDMTETALVNIKDIITKSYEQVVYGATDELNNENRLAIQKELKALQEQVYSEGNAEYAGRTVFTGYKTNHKLTFTDSEEAKNSDYDITEHLSYLNMETKSYYVNQNRDTTANYLLNHEAVIPQEYELKRIRLSYDNLEKDDSMLMLRYTYKDPDTGKTEETKVGLGGDAVVLGNLKFEKGAASTDQSNQNGTNCTCTDPNAKEEKVDITKYTDGTNILGSFDRNTKTGAITLYDANGNEAGTLSIGLDVKEETNGNTTTYYTEDADKNKTILGSYVYDSATGAKLYSGDGAEKKEVGSLTFQTPVTATEQVSGAAQYYLENEDGSKTVLGSYSHNAGQDAIVYDASGYQIGKVSDDLKTISVKDGTGSDFSFTYNVGDTTAAQDTYYKQLSETEGNEVFFNHETGELILSSGMADQLESKRAAVEASYHKVGFDVGEVRPENFFDCTNNMDSDHPIEYQNFDEEGNWITEGIYYNIANKQAMQINTEARDVFDANIYRDMDELIDIVNMAIDSQNAVDSIKEKLNSGIYEKGSDDYVRLNDWLDAANKQLDYAVQNMHDAFSSSITTFQGYLQKVNLAVTDAGSRGERVALTKTRMSVQQTTFEELKSKNEDADLSDLMIDYSAAYTSYQAALQAAGKIGKMTLLDYI